MPADPGPDFPRVPHACELRDREPSPCRRCAVTRCEHGRIPGLADEFGTVLRLSRRTAHSTSARQVRMMHVVDPLLGDRFVGECGACGYRAERSSRDGARAATSAHLCPGGRCYTCGAAIPTSMVEHRDGGETYCWICCPKCSDGGDAA